MYLRGGIFIVCGVLIYAVCCISAKSGGTVSKFAPIQIILAVVCIGVYCLLYFPCPRRGERTSEQIVSKYK